MLFYTQIKREFTHLSWKRGQNYFREERVSNVKLEGEVVSGRVRGTASDAYETAIVMSHGTIQNSKCSCPIHRRHEPHCKHVAALAIWMVERGSLLRSGVSAGEFGVAAEDNEVVLKDFQKALSDGRVRKLLQAHPVLTRGRFAIRRERMLASIVGKDPNGGTFDIPITLVEAAAMLEHVGREEAAPPEQIIAQPILFVKGVFQGRVLAAISVESGLRYHAPVEKSVQIVTLSFLKRQADPAVYKTTQGLLLRVPPMAQIPDHELSFIDRLDTQKMFYYGQFALENLAKLLQHRNRDQILFDSTVTVPIHPNPLRLVGLNIGKKGEASRELSYEFKCGDVHLTSRDLDELASQNRLSTHYAWVGDRIYRLETSLAKLAQYANRTGVAQQESPDSPPRVTGFGALHDDSESPLHPLAAYRLSLELGVENFKVDEDWEEFHSWKKTFDKKKIPLLPKVGYGYKLRAYQRNGLGWLWSLYHRGLAALLADEMGLGKTHQVLAFLSSLYRVKKKPKLPSLVVAPTSVIAAWQQKLTKYKTGLKCHVFHGSGRHLPKSGVDVVLTTYGILQREPDLREREWHVVILDEAQAIKNAQTISSRASRTLKSKFRIAMTGTPVENQSTDLWSLMEFMIPGYLGTLPRFKRLYGWGRETPPEVQAEALRRLISPFLLRRTKAQVLKELPEKTENVVACEMTEVQRKAYRVALTSEDAEKIRKDLRGTGKIDYANILALLTRLKQVCDHPRLADITAGRVKVPKIDPAESGKWETIEELLDEALGSGLKVVVFTQYLGMMDLIGHALEKRGVGYTDLRGDTPDRAARLEKFQNEPDCRVFVCSLLAGGLGIDLTAASVCIHVDRWWNPAKENQATDRLHRFGQTRGVQVFKLQIPGSVEDRIASIIESKVALSGALIEESSVGLKAFSRKDLLELLSPVD